MAKVKTRRSNLNPKARRKECSVCEWKMPRRFFNSESRSTDGLRSECKYCQYLRMMRSIRRKIKEIKNERDSLCD